jgi:hypothetical protein
MDAGSGGICGNMPGLIGPLGAVIPAPGGGPAIGGAPIEGGPTAGGGEGGATSPDELGGGTPGTALGIVGGTV